MRPSLFERYSPVTVSAVGGLVAVIVSVALIYGSVSWIGMDEMDWVSVILLTILCPALIAPPIIYFQCRTLRRISQQKQELATANAQLKSALNQVEELSGLLPICAWCHNVRDDTGYWEAVEAFIERKHRVSVTHGICPDCRSKELSKLERRGG